jgi:hypothetical protein
MAVATLAGVLLLSLFLVLVPRVKAEQNLLVNPGFESGLTGWSTSGGTAVYSADYTISHSRSYSCKGVETHTGGLGRLYQDVTAITSPGNQYQISAWIKTSNVVGTAVIALNYVEAGGWTPGDGYVMDWIGTGGTTGWTFYQSPVFTLPSMPSEATALWFLFDFNNGAGTAWWDDVSLVCVSGDLILEDFEPVQVVYGASALVADKPTLVKVDVYNSFSQPKTTTLTLTFDGITYVTSRELPANELTAVYLPSHEFLLPKGDTSSVSVSVETVAGETDTTNNHNESSFAVRKADQLRILYVPVWYQDGEETFVSDNDMHEMARRSTEFIEGTYPLSPSKCGYNVSPVTYDYRARDTPLSFLGIFDMCYQLAFKAWIGGYDKAVGVLPEGWFARNMYGKWKNARGVSVPFSGAVLVEDKYWTTSAHEIGHTYGLWKSPLPEPEEYEEFPETSGRIGNGVWVVKRESGGDWFGDYFLRDNSVCFMGNLVSKEWWGHVWVDNDCYENLLESLTSPSQDPDVIFLSGLIYENDTVETENWYSMQNGTASLDFGSSGNYSIVYLDDEGADINAIGFDPLFLCTDNSTGQNVTCFMFSVPYVVNTAEIQIRHDNVTIYDRMASANAPIVNVSYPNGGETVLSGDNCTISWESSDLDLDPLTYNVMLSSDNGSSWVPLATDLTENSYVWNTSYLQSGDNYLVKILATDGINTGENVSNSTFTVTTHDVSVSDVVVAPTEDCSQLANVTITVRNEGDFPETLDVTAWADNNITSIGDEISIGDTTAVGLDPGNQMDETLVWNTTKVPEGYYAIVVHASPVANETDTADNEYVIGAVRIAPFLIVQSVEVANQGCTVYADDRGADGVTAKSVQVQIAVKNVATGSVDSFNVSLTAYSEDGSLVESYFEWNVMGLAAGDSVTLTYNWHPMRTGNYTLTAFVNCHGEISETSEGDNTFVLQKYPVALIGDLNGDNVVNILDVGQIGLAWHSRPGDEYWNVQADLNHDGYINIFDIVRITLRWHQTW